MPHNEGYFFTNESVNSSVKLRSVLPPKTFDMKCSYFKILYYIITLLFECKSFAIQV